MRILRLTEHTAGTPGRYRVEVALEGAGPRMTATSTFDFAITAQDREDIRWYLEDYLLFPLDPAPTIAERIEARMAALGEELCRGVFLDPGNRDATRLWDRAREELRDTRVEVITDVRHAASVPWELLRDPESHTALALEAQAFVRSHSMATKLPRGAAAVGAGPVRILLVICRPAGGKDVPFRSVASKLLKELDQASREVVQLDVLRPPTFAELSAVLRAAKLGGRPYHVVHFDGHGAYLDEGQQIADGLSGVNVHVLGGRKGTHGFLVFENPHEVQRERGELIDGPKLGALLVETGVPVLVLNACRSAHADPPEKPETAPEGAPSDPHGDIASFGSLALEVMDKGVSGVVAMRYNVYVVTAAQFVADLYGGLANGLALGEAVTLGRKQLHAQPQRELAFARVPLQDWCVPVVYEVEAIPLFPAPVVNREIKLVLGGEPGGGERGARVEVPAAPDVGFFGRDETLLALDRAFDRHGVVLLHAYAGSGKSSTAAEFARWYKRTGGVEGPVLWTSFERRMTLPQVLDALGRVFVGTLEKNGVQWLALDDGERRGIALQILKQTPVLWVWDNVEPVTGFPAGTASAWTAEEQKELVDFLREARGTKAKFLLTSRREEQAWLGELPARIAVPAMPMRERVEFARALAGKRGARLEEVGDWRPLLAFTQGNPLTITMLVGQALRDGVRTKEQVAEFVGKLRAGEGAFEDDEKEGRSRSLGASLSYGFEGAFGEGDRKILALLHLFQGYVQVAALMAMGYPTADWRLPELRAMTQEAGMALLDRAAEIGLLSARGARGFAIHPAVPWYLRRRFEEHYPEERREGDGSDATSAKHAFVMAMGECGNFYWRQYEQGHSDAVDALEDEEHNLLHARDLARRHGWWGGVIRPMQGLRHLYGHTGRSVDWARLVDEVKGDFVDPESDGPVTGREEQWGLVSEYRTALAVDALRWGEREQLQQANVRWHRERAAAALSLPADAVDAEQRLRIRNLAVSVHMLGEIQRECGRAECIGSYAEAAELAKRGDDRVVYAAVALTLGHAYKNLPAIRDLAEAERWYRQSLALRGERQGRAQCLCQLAFVAYERFSEARVTNHLTKDPQEHLDAALRFSKEALDLLPSNAVSDLAATHHQLGIIHSVAGDLDRAMVHYQESMRLRERQNYLYGAAMSRFCVALALSNAGRLADARAYALAALRNFETYGDRAADRIQQTQNLLAQIDNLLTPKPQ